MTSPVRDRSRWPARVMRSPATWHPAPGPVNPARAMPADRGKPGQHAARPGLDERQPRGEAGLELARLDDGIEVTAPPGMIHVTTTDDVGGDVVLDLLRQSQD